MTAYSMALLWQNIRYALRTSVRSPGFAAVTAISLALGIGANTAIFSILDAVLFPQLPVPQPHTSVTASAAACLAPRAIHREGGHCRQDADPRAPPAGDDAADGRDVA